MMLRWITAQGVTRVKFVDFRPAGCEYSYLGLVTLKLCVLSNARKTQSHFNIVIPHKKSIMYKQRSRGYGFGCLYVGPGVGTEKLVENRSGYLYCI